MAGVVDRAAQVPGAVGGIAVPGQAVSRGRAIIWLARAARDLAAGRAVRAARSIRRARLGGQELLRHRRVGVLRPGGPGQLLIGDDPGLRVTRDMRPVSVPAGLGGLAGMPGIGIDRRDGPVFGDLAGDPPTPSPPVTTL